MTGEAWVVIALASPGFLVALVALLRGYSIHITREDRRRDDP